jgi:hypothetical protein
MDLAALRDAVLVGVGQDQLHGVASIRPAVAAAQRRLPDRLHELVAQPDRAVADRAQPVASVARGLS